MLTERRERDSVRYLQHVHDGSGHGQPCFADRSAPDQQEAEQECPREQRLGFLALHADTAQHRAYRLKHEVPHQQRPADCNQDGCHFVENRDFRLEIGQIGCEKFEQLVQKKLDHFKEKCREPLEQPFYNELKNAAASFPISAVSCIPMPLNSGVT